MLRFITFILLTAPVLCFAQNIDKITTDQQALEFVNKYPISKEHDFNYSIQLNKPLRGISKDTSDKTFPAFHIFEKADFDNNGYTDLLFNGYSSFMDSEYSTRTSLLIFAYGNDSFSVQHLSNFLPYAFFSASLLLEGNKNLITIRYAIWDTIADSLYLKTGTDTLIAFRGNLIEKRTASIYPIEKINYYLKTQILIQRAPGFTLTLQSDSSWLMQEVYTDDGSHWNEVLSVCKTPPDVWTHLCELFNQMNFTGMNDVYDIQGSLHAYCIFEINYDKGKTKKISDYNLPATFGLEVIEQLLFNYFSTQKWKEINAPLKK